MKVSKTALYQLNKYFITFLVTTNDFDSICLLGIGKFTLEKKTHYLFFL
jgi:hypothetical protein